MANKLSGPVVLELASLPREQVGPFLLLGLDKAADKKVIEASWAQRVIWARKGQIKTPLEDINWAREVVNDPDKRIRADVASLNVDTTEGVLRKLAQKYQGGQAGAAAARLLDVEKPLGDYTPAVEVPGLDEVRAAITVPDVPEEIPAVRRVLEQFLQEPLDPWKLNLPS
jgi:hypothetical protein